MSAEHGLESTPGFALPPGFLDPIINPDSEWRDLTDDEFDVLYAYLDTGYRWDNDHFKVASDYLKGQYEHNLRDNIIDSEETTMDPSVPDRFLYTRPQEIHRLVIRQVENKLGMSSDLDDLPAGIELPTFGELLEKGVPSLSDRDAWIRIEEMTEGARSKKGHKSLEQLHRGQRKRRIAEGFASFKLALGFASKPDQSI